jgi:hypothetical protein
MLLTLRLSGRGIKQETCMRKIFSHVYSSLISHSLFQDHLPQERKLSYSGIEFWKMSFAATCSDISLKDGHILACYAVDQYGSSVYATLDLNGFIGNDDGTVSLY